MNEINKLGLPSSEAALRHKVATDDPNRKYIFSGYAPGKLLEDATIHEHTLVEWPSGKVVENAKNFTFVTWDD